MLSKLIRYWTSLLLILLLIPNFSFAECVDPDGDGYGMNGNRPCRARRTQNSSTKVTVRDVRISEVTKSSARITATFGDNSSGKIYFGKTQELDKVGPYSGFLKRKLFNQSLTNLEPATTYYFKVEARIGSQRAYSSVRTFTTEGEKEGSETCPKKVYYKEGNITSVPDDTTISTSITLTKELPLRWKYYPTAQGQEEAQFTACELSNKFKSHNQNIPDLTPNTEYTLVAQSASSMGSDCNNTEWLNISCPLQETTLEVSADSHSLSLADMPFNVRNEQNVKEGDLIGVAGVTPSGEGDRDLIQITIPPNGTSTYDGRYYFPEGETEVWVSYLIFLGDTFTTEAAIKLPGLSSTIIESWTGYDAKGISGAGGAGGNWGGDCRSWSTRHFMGAAVHSSSKWQRRMGIELYHRNSNNFGNTPATLADHPCDSSANNPAQKNLRQFGQTVQGSVGPANLNMGKWHQVKQHVKLNSLGQFDGLVEGWIDGKLIYRETGLNLTNNPEYRRMAFWFTVYHGGSADRTGTAHDLFFDKIRVSSGPTDIDKLP